MKWDGRGTRRSHRERPSTPPAAGAGVERYGGPASNPRTEAPSEILGCAHAHGCCESSEAELARRELLELITAPDVDVGGAIKLFLRSLAPLLPVARGLSQGIWNMTRARMRQHEYYFIVQRRLARHYCWLELLSRPTSVLAHDRRSLYASCAFLCVGLRTQSRTMGVAGVSACRPGASRHVPCLSFKRHLCGPFFCASLEVRRPPRITRAIAARTRRQTTVDTRHATGDRTQHDHVRGPPLHR